MKFNKSTADQHYVVKCTLLSETVEVIIQCCVLWRFFAVLWHILLHSLCCTGYSFS